MIVKLENTAGAEVGDQITLAAATGKVAKGSLLAYLFPLAMLLTGVALGSLISDLWAIVLGVGLCLAAYGVLRLLDRRWKKNKTFAPRIGRVIKGGTELMRDSDTEDGND